jgi:hypothetical protein
MLDEPPLMVRMRVSACFKNDGPIDFRRERSQPGFNAQHGKILRIPDLPTIAMTR